MPAQSSIVAKFRSTLRNAPRNPSAPRPDFIGIGAQKAGTTWLASNLYAHPGVWRPFRKEIHHFDARHLRNLDRARKETQTHLIAALEAHRRRGARPERIAYLESLLGEQRIFTDDWYGDVFSPAPPNKRTGEITPYYLLLPEAGIEDLRRSAPAAKLICLIRDPLDRARSAFRMYLGLAKVALDDPEAVARAAEVWMRETGPHRGDYADALPRWEAHYKPGRDLLYLPFGRIATDPSGLMREVESFLGLRRFHRYPKLGDVVHPTPRAALPAALEAALAAHCAPHRDWLERRFPAEFTAQIR